VLSVLGLPCCLNGCWFGSDGRGGWLRLPLVLVLCCVALLFDKKLPAGAFQDHLLLANQLVNLDRRS
jgi:hypothetical protein